MKHIVTKRPITLYAKQKYHKHIDSKAVKLKKPREMVLVTRLKEESPVGLKPRVGRKVGKVIFSRLWNFLAPSCAFLTKENVINLKRVQH